MKKIKSNKMILSAAAVFLLGVIVHIISHIIQSAGSMPYFLWLLETIVFIFLFAFWGYSLKFRIVQLEIRRLLLGICNSIIVWIMIGSIKKLFISDPLLVRHCGYLSYSIDFLIPTLIVLAATCIGKPDEYRITRKELCFFGIPACCFIAFFLTNDLHRMVFAFSNEKFDAEYIVSYKWGFWLSQIWIVLCLIRSLRIYLKRIKKGNRKSGWLTFIIFMAALSYTMLMIFKARFFAELIGDISIVLGIVYVLMIESCIYKGFIGSYEEYGELFEIGTSGNRLVDKEGNTFLKSSYALPISQEMIKHAMVESVDFNDSFRFNSTVIQGGYVIWQENVFEINNLLKQLHDNQEELQERLEIQKETYETKRRVEISKEKNRLYDELMNQTKEKINIITELLDEYKRADAPEYKKQLLGRICIIGSYIKRRGNLIYLRELNGAVDFYGLALSFEETLSNLKYLGIDSGIDVKQSGLVSYEEAMFCYEIIEEIIEKKLNDITFLWLKARSEGECFVIHMEIETDEEEPEEPVLEKIFSASKENLSAMKKKTNYASLCDGNILNFNMTIRKAGEA